MPNVWTPLLGLLAPLVAPVQHHAYRRELERGLAALAAGERDAAVERFQAAGELAPGAPVWKAYLRHAQGQPVGDVLEFQADAGKAWHLVPPTRREELQIDPTGERVLVGTHDPALWDLRTGALIAALSRRSEKVPFDWRFDRTGKLLIGCGGSFANEKDDGLDVRDARTGESLAVLGGEMVPGSRFIRFEWLPPGAPAMDRTLEHGGDIPVSGGFLRWRAIYPSPNEDYAMRADGRRAIFLNRQVPTRLRLMDVAANETLAEFSPGGDRSSFSPDGRYVVSLQEDELLVVDAETGVKLTGPRIQAAPTEFGRALPILAFEGGQLVLIEPSGVAVWWSLGQQRETRRVDLQPPPRTPFSWFSQAQFVAGGEVLLLQGFEAVQAYDTGTGRQLWSIERFSYAFDRSQSVAGDLVGIASDGQPTRMAHVRTSETRVELESNAFSPATGNLVLVPGSQRAVVAAGDGSLALVDLPSGRTLGTGREPLHPGRMELRWLGSGKLATWSPGSRLIVRDAENLAESWVLDLQPRSRVLAVDESGRQAVIRLASGEVELRSAGSDTVESLIHAAPTTYASAAFDSKGTLLAIGEGSRVHVFELGSTNAPSQIELNDGESPTEMRFLDESRIAVGWGTGSDAFGVNVYECRPSRFLGRLTPRDAWMMGGHVRELRHDRDLETLTYSVGNYGMVVALSTVDWSERWAIDFRGGNGATIHLNREPSSRRLCISGMGPKNSRIVDARTGEVLALPEVEGLCSLASSAGDEYVIGLQDGKLVVLDGRSLERLYARTELPGGAAWLERGNGDWEWVGSAAPDWRSIHLIRDGLSKPADCWDTWLFDPLGIAKVPLGALPEPPRLLDGPARVVQAAGDEIECVVEVDSQDTLLGIQIVRDKAFSGLSPAEGVPSGTPARLLVKVSGPWPADVELRALSRAGVLSAPWRVRVEAAR